MDGLVQLVQDLSKAKNLSEIISRVSSAARRVTDADGATFVLRDNGYCFYVDEDAIGPLWKGKRFPLSACVSGWAMLNKESVAIKDIFNDPRVPIEAYKPTFVRSLAMVPIRKDDPVGAIGNYWARPHVATEAEMQSLQAIADVTSVAIQNVHLISLMEERVQQLENANHVKDEFLMLISHELRTPLSAILGWSEMLIESSEDRIQRGQGLQSIYKNAKAQCHVVDNLLDASSIVLGQFQVEKKETDFVRIVQIAILNAQKAAAQRNIRLSLSTSLESVQLMGEEPRLRQLVETLLENAIQFSYEGGSVIVELLKEGPSVTLRVKDFGAGLTAEALPQLFNRFSQNEKYLTRAHSGLGIGLMIAKSIVQAHQGDISVSSDGLGKGAEFTVTLPLLSARKRPEMEIRAASH